MHKQEVSLSNISVFNSYLMEKGMYMQHMSFKGHKRKIAMSGCRE